MDGVWAYAIKWLRFGPCVFSAVVNLPHTNCARDEGTRWICTVFMIRMFSLYIIQFISTLNIEHWTVSLSTSVCVRVSAREEGEKRQTRDDNSEPYTQQTRRVAECTVSICIYGCVRNGYDGIWMAWVYGGIAAELCGYGTYTTIDRVHRMPATQRKNVDTM